MKKSFDLRNFKQMQRMVRAAGDKALRDTEGERKEREKEENIKRSINKRIAQEKRKNDLLKIKDSDPLKYKVMTKLNSMWDGSGRKFVNHLIFSYAPDEIKEVTSENPEGCDMKCVLTGKKLDKALTGKDTTTVIDPEALVFLKEFSKKVRKPNRNNKRK